MKLIFLHIPKNGGMTLHKILEKNYLPESIFTIQVIDHIKLNTDDFINLPLEERKKIKVLKGHMLYGLHRYFNAPSQYITFLRKPEDRLYSFYHYVKKRPHHRLYTSIFGNNMSFEEFVINIDPGDTHNAQIRFISGLKNSSEEEMLKLAKENIDNHFIFVGLLEKYNLSLVLLKKSLNLYNIYYKTVNKGSYKTKKINEETLKIIREKNKGDYELYRHIENRMKQKTGFKVVYELIHFNLLNYYFNSKVYKSTKLKQARRRLKNLTIILKL